MRMRKWTYTMAGIALMVVMAGCGTVQPVALTAAANQGQQATLANDLLHAFTGKVEGIEEVTIYAKSSGRVASVFHDTGDEIQAGAPLFGLEQEELAASLRIAKADLALVKAKWEEAKKGTRTEEVLYAQAGWQQANQKYLDLKNGKRPEEMAQLEASYQSAKTNVELTAAKRDRTQALYVQGAVSKQAWEDTQSAYSQAEAQYRRSEEDLAMAKQGATQPTLQAMQANVEQMKAMYDKAKNGATPEQIAQYAAGVERAQAAVDNAEYQLKNATITSPIKGYVSTKSIHAGEMISPSVAAMTVVNTEKVYVVMGVAEKDLERFALGKEVDVAVDALHKSMRGKVERISPKADAGTDTFTVKIVIENKDGALRSGMTGIVSL
ncbi:efflux RND transporter periplasmic adaptor subunit [Brevibacillus choshinensis]|uniref:HlyD family secretion protein n=1 Tax=Brevibacillus choshinensis TaxID=54911 RepID=UPI002E21DF11|nr:efflux RND transporter periplasmic adaptor subunit [Brevibacillus choshinensis]